MTGTPVVRRLTAIMFMMCTDALERPDVDGYSKLMAALAHPCAPRHLDVLTNGSGDTQ